MSLGTKLYRICDIHDSKSSIMHKLSNDCIVHAQNIRLGVKWIFKNVHFTKREKSNWFGKSWAKRIEKWSSGVNLDVLIPNYGRHYTQISRITMHVSIRCFERYIYLEWLDCIFICMYTCNIRCTGVTCCLSYSGCCGEGTTFLSL